MILGRMMQQVERDTHTLTHTQDAHSLTHTHRNTQHTHTHTLNMCTLSPLPSSSFPPLSSFLPSPPLPRSLSLSVSQRGQGLVWKLKSIHSVLGVHSLPTE